MEGGDSAGGLTGKGLDTLLAAAEALPHAAADAWRLDLFRVALRIARSTEAPADLDRADIAFKSLPTRLRAPLAELAATLARREAERNAAPAADPPPARGRRLFDGLLRRSADPPSGATARERLLRELLARRPPDDDR